jgi:hypothetical protein
MKKILLILLTICTLTAKSQTAVYHSFPDSSAIWNFHYSLVLCSPFGSIDSYYSITISSDTLINSQVYHKLYTPFVQSVVSGLCPPLNLDYEGAIRQDTANRKVFYVAPSASTEQLLYDFNMQVGDTVKGFLESFASPTDTVHSIDSVLVGTNYRKRWNINPWYNIYLIEGIGSTYGLVVPSPGFIVDFADYTLTCFTQNGQTLYPDTITNCVLITDAENIYPEYYLTTISPNPFTDKINITTERNEPVEITLFDITSRKLLQQTLTNAVTLNTSHLAKGIYLYVMRNKNGPDSYREVKKGKIVKD